MRRDRPTTPATLRDSLLQTARDLGDAPLLSLPGGTVVDLKTGYIPLLVNFSVEDKAAKGLRTLQDQAEPAPAVYFSALEMVRDHTALLLLGETGSGKTSFARHLAFRLADGGVPHQVLPRNDQGAAAPESIDLAGVVPVYVAVAPGRRLSDQLADAAPGLAEALDAPEATGPDATGPGGTGADTTLLIILDGVEAAGADLACLLTDALDLQSRHPRIRLVALGEKSAVARSVVPSALTRIDLLPLLKVQRRDAALRLAQIDLAPTGTALGPAAANPVQFAMALIGGDPGETPEALADAWLARLCGDGPTAAFLCGLAYDGLAGRLDDPTILPVTRVRQLLAARHLASRPPEEAIAPFRAQPGLWSPVLESLAVRLAGTDRSGPLIDALVGGEGEGAQRGALLASRLAGDGGPARDRVAATLLTIVETGALSAAEREMAGRTLAAWGDPRDVAFLVDVPGGPFAFGSASHPNSAPPGVVAVDPFRIGRYPVVNADYAAFADHTGRRWRSPDGRTPERASAPATDLTWHDARAYCAWLTERWRSQGRIGADEQVRLPTEPEWEKAARGDGPDRGADNGIVYPWGPDWRDDAANSEEAGFNTTCTVGLFPRGRSPYGCDDMTGQVWEWCTTLWGTDMATPDFAYPYASDGREQLDAAPSIRRVLRGGCFSSGRLKACCTYRGSLEPDGFWRGNGFRIVVARNSAG